MSGGSDSTTQTTSMPDWAQPYATSYLDNASKVASQPYTPYGGQRVADLNGAQQSGMTAIANRAMNGSPLFNTAAGTLQSTAAGDFMGAGNPYMQQMVDASSQDVMRNYNQTVMPGIDAVEARGGSFGNSGVNQLRQNAASDLTKNLGNISSGLRFQGYDAERQRQMQALGLAPGYANQDYTDAQQLINAGSMGQANTQQGLDAAYQDWQNAQNYPAKQLGILGNALGINTGSTSTTNGPTGSGLGQGLGAALAAWAAYNNGNKG